MSLDINDLKKVLQELKKELNISDEIKLEIKPMKTQAASISFRTKTIRINKNLIDDLDMECFRYLILHELIHYKTKSKYHNYVFYKYLYEKISETEAKKLDEKIINAILKINGINKR